MGNWVNPGCAKESGDISVQIYICTKYQFILLNMVSKSIYIPRVWAYIHVYCSNVGSITSLNSNHSMTCVYDWSFRLYRLFTLGNAHLRKLLARVTALGTFWIRYVIVSAPDPLLQFLLYLSSFLSIVVSLVTTVVLFVSTVLWLVVVPSVKSQRTSVSRSTIKLVLSHCWNSFHTIITCQYIIHIMNVCWYQNKLTLEL